MKAYGVPRQFDDNHQWGGPSHFNCVTGRAGKSRSGQKTSAKKAARRRAARRARRDGAREVDFY